MSPPAGAAERFTKGGFVEVDVGRIEHDLAELWRTASSDEGVVTRACAWNLVYSLPGVAATEDARALVDALVEQVPARVLLLCKAASGGQEAPLAAWVSARCRRQGKDKVVCSEEITVSHAPEHDGRVPPLVRALLVTDVPTAWLAHGTSPLSDAIAPALLPQVDRVLVDSDRGGADPARFFDEIGRLVARGKVVDLGWLRVAGLLALFADLFDDAEGTRPLESATRVAIHTAPNGLATGWLVAAWLASRLRWDVAARESDHRWFASRRDGGTVELSVTETSRAEAPGLCHLALDTPRGRYALERRETEVAVEAVGRAPRVVPRRRRAYHELVAKALTSSQAVGVLREVVPIARALGGGR